MSDERPAWRKQLEQSLAELEALGKQVGSKLGGVAKDASHEAHAAWRELEPRLGALRAKVQSQVEGSLPSRDRVPVEQTASQLQSQLQNKLREVGSEAAEQLEGMVAELRSSLKTLRDKL